MRNKQRGFSLIELLIVVAIILIIAAIAIPNLLRSRIAANEAAAVYSVRTIDTAQITYSSTYPTEGYACVLSKLGPGTDGTMTKEHAGLIDSVLASGNKSGYKVEIVSGSCSGTPANAYQVTATPVSPNQTGIRQFCSDQSAAIRYSDTSSGCTPASPPLQ